MTISLPEDLKQFVKKRSLTAHYGTPSDYIRGLIREDLKRLEQEVESPIAIDIHHGELYCRCLRALFPKTDAVRINRVRVEVVIRENGDRDDPGAPRIDAVRKVTRSDIDEHLCHGFIHCSAGDGREDIGAAYQEDEQSTDDAADYQWCLHPFPP